MLFMTWFLPPVIAGINPAPEFKTLLTTMPCDPKVSGRLHSVGLRPDGPLQRFGDPLGVRHSRTSRPQHQRLVAVTDVADVLGLVLVDRRIGIREANAFADPSPCLPVCR